MVVLASLPAVLAAATAGDELFQLSVRSHDVLVRPEGTGPFPAVILLHGCAGPTNRDRLWAERLRLWGYLTLRVNSFAPRGLQRVCAGGILGTQERVPDVLAALAYLRTRSEVDPHRIGMLGWSHGGGTALMTLGAAPEDPAEGFRAAIAFYPGCRGIPAWRSRTSTLVLIAGADDWSAPAPCQALVERQQGNGLEVMQVTYANAQHGFDNPLLGPEARRVPEALGGRGATIQYDPEAAGDSRVRVREFLGKRLKD